MSHLLCLDPCLYMYPKVGHLPIFLKIHIYYLSNFSWYFSKQSRPWLVWASLWVKLSRPFSCLRLFRIALRIRSFFYFSWKYYRSGPSCVFMLLVYSNEKNHFVKTYTEFTFNYFSLNWLLLWKQRISHFFYKIS